MTRGIARSEPRQFDDGRLPGHGSALCPALLPPTRRDRDKRASRMGAVLGRPRRRWLSRLPRAPASGVERRAECADHTTLVRHDDRGERVRARRAGNRSSEGPAFATTARCTTELVHQLVIARETVEEPRAEIIGIGTRIVVREMDTPGGHDTVYGRARHGG